MSDLTHWAAQFACEAHKGQERKYTGEPYFNHVREVAQIVASVPHTPEMVAAAYLHDTVEDTTVTLPMIQNRFGEVVARLVYWLTDQSKPSDGNRKARKTLDRAHSALAPAEAQTIKLADLISNTGTIVEFDTDFATVYLREKAKLLEVLTKGDPTLLKRAHEQVRDGMEKLANLGLLGIPPT